MSSTLPNAVTPFIWRFVKTYPFGFFAIFITCLAWTIDQTVWPYLFKELIDGLLAYEGDKSGIWHYLLPLLLSWGGLWLTIELGFRLQGMFMAFYFPKVAADARMAMFSYVQGHSYHYFSDNFAGSISNKINDMPRGMVNILMMVLSLFSPGILAVVIAVSMAMAVHPLFASIMLVWVVLHLGTCIVTAKKCIKMADEHSESLSTLSGKVVDALTNVLTTKMFARAPFERRYVDQYQQVELENNQHALWYIEKVKVVLGLLSFIFPGGFLTWFMIYAWQHSMITIGEMVMIFNMNWNIMMIVWFSGSRLPDFFKEVGVCRQALSIVNQPHAVTDEPGAKPLPLGDGRVEYRNVDFHYGKGKGLFDHLSLTIEAGQKVGLVGFSGSGKTTFVNLMMRFFDVEGGQILINGRNIRTATKDSVRDAIAMIPQDPTLFHRSLMDNIRYGRLDATDEEVIEVAKKAHCHEFVMKMDQGYQTLVGERGVKLSGGQRQRIAIARAMLKNAPILVLDEATSALDSLTEKDIQDSLHEAMEGRTTIVVAHRLSTLAEMDRILVFDKGNIIEEGAHRSLLRKKGHYAHMWQMQSGGFLPEGG
jgi:ATP-binding cassette subfamily B protein